MSKVYSYLRFSTDIQSLGDSTRRQLQLARDYCEKNGLVLDETLSFHDHGVSAFRGDNVATGKLGLFLKCIEEGRVRSGDCLLVESLDRISRNAVMDALSIFTKILGHGITIITLSDGRTYTKESCNDIGNILMSIVIMSRAHEESAMKSRRVGAAWQNKRDRALSGHIMTATIPAWLRLKEDRSGFDIIKARALLILEIFNMAINGYGIDAISRILNKRRVDTWEGGIHRSRKSKGWHSSYIFKILHNRAVLGEITPTKRVYGTPLAQEPIPNYYPQIIPTDIFVKAVAALGQRRTKGGRPATVENLFAGLLRCGYCGGSVVRTNKGNKYPVYYSCLNHKRGVSKCGFQKWICEEFDNIALAEIKEITIDKLVPQEHATTISSLHAKLITIDDTIKQTQHKVERLLEAIETDGSVILLTERLKQVEMKLDNMKTEKRKIEIQYDKEKGKRETTSRTIQETASLIELLNQSGSQEVRLKLRQQIRELVERLEVRCNERRFTIRYKSHYMVMRTPTGKRRTFIDITRLKES